MVRRVVQVGAVAALVFLAAACTVAIPGSLDRRDASRAARTVPEAPVSRLPVVLPTVGGQSDLAYPVAPIALAATASRPPGQLRERKILETYANLPLSFETNRGQEHPDVKFLARGRGYTVFLTGTEAVITLTGPTGPAPHAPPLPGAARRPSRVFEPAVLRMQLVGARPSPPVAGIDELPGRVNYFLGNDPDRWRTDVPTYGKVRYHDVYPGIDVVYYGAQRQLEHDFIVAPGGDPGAIRVAFPGSDGLAVAENGDLVIRVGREVVRHRKPVIYQPVDGGRREIAGSFLLHGEQVGFQVAAYDASRPLVIDPVLAYSTYLGGSGDDFGCGIAVDADGSAYVTGWTGSVSFPVVPGAVQPFRAGGLDAFIVKINPQGNALVYSTFLGGRGNEFEVIGLAVDSGGHAYVTGLTESSDFPTTSGAFQTALKGHVNIFVAKLNRSGSALTYSTYLGGSVIDGSQSIVVDLSGNAYVTGFTQSSDFPTTPGAFQPASGGGQDAFVAKLNPAGSGLVYSTYLGGSDEEFAPGLAVDGAGSAYVTGYTRSTNFPTTPGAFQTVAGGGGQDAFVTKLNPAGDGLVYSTFLGGSGVDEGRDVTLGPAGNAYVVGHTESVDFPTTSLALQPALKGANDVFVTQLHPSGSALLYSSYLGGGGPDISRRIAVDGLGNAYVAGATNSPDFPTTADAIQATHAGGEDVFVTKINPEGSAILFSTFLGGTGNDRARGMTLDAAGNVFVTGFTSSTDFPTANPVQPGFAGGVGNCFFSGGCDAFVAKIGRIPPVDLTLRSTTAAVARGGEFPFTIEISNTTAQPQEAAFVLILHVAPGLEFPLTQPIPVGLPPNITVTGAIHLGPIPLTAPTGQWTVQGLVVRPKPGGIEFVDQSLLPFTVH